MAHEDGRRRKLPNDALVVIDYRPESQTPQGGRIPANRFNFAFHPGPRWCENAVACFLETVDPILEAPRSEKETVNQDYGWPAGDSRVGAHGCPPENGSGFNP